MQPRPSAGRENDIVRIAFALQEYEERLVAAVHRDVFGQAKPHRHVEFQFALHVRHQQLEVIDALRHGAVMMLETGYKPRLCRHGGAEFERGAERIADMQRSTLVRPLDPLRRQSCFLEIKSGLL